MNNTKIFTKRQKCLSVNCKDSVNLGLLQPLEALFVRTAKRFGMRFVFFKNVGAIILLGAKEVCISFCFVTCCVFQNPSDGIHLENSGGSYSSYQPAFAFSEVYHDL
jgi:hypothetical protein